MLGVGLDSDGHKRITQGHNFALVGGSEETHEAMTEKAIKINEKLEAKGKQLTGFATAFILRRADFGISALPEGIANDVNIFIGFEGIKK